MSKIFQIFKFLTWGKSSLFLKKFGKSNHCSIKSIVVNYQG